MANLKTDDLFQLIQSLKKAEKRNFKLYAKRNNPSRENAKFIQLFDVLDSMSSYNETLIFKKLPEIKKTQLSNIKAHLYGQILVTLRLQHVNQNIDVQLRENLDYAKILYNKGLYQQSLRVLDKNRSMALEAKQYTLALETLEFEKLIESQYITRSIDTRAEELSNKSIEYGNIVRTTNDLSNLALNLYGLYLKFGHVRNEKDFISIKAYMDSKLPQVNEESLSFFEKIYLYQSYVWYYYISQDFVMCYRYAQKWVDLFTIYPEMRDQQPTFYLKGLHNLLAALFYLQHYTKFCEVLEELENFKETTRLHTNENIDILIFLYTYTNRINKYYMEGAFTEGLSLVPELLAEIEEHSDRLDPHRILVFHYKIACLYFGSGDNLKAIEYLEKVLAFKDHDLRGDIHCFARILNLIAHYEEGLDEHLDRQIKSVYHFLGKMNDLQLVQQEVFNFLRKIGRINPLDLQKEFKYSLNRLIAHGEKKYEKRPFFYLDLISWVESKIANKPVQEVIRAKFESRIQN